MTIQSAVRRSIYTPIARGLQCCSTCPSGSTVDENGVISRLHITICLCDPPVRGLGGETPSVDDVTLFVNGSSVGWTLSGGLIVDNCITWDVNQPLSYGDIPVVTFDAGWINPADAPSFIIRNRIPAPLQLLTLPSFDPVTGRLDRGDYYNARTGNNSTFINSDSRVEGVTAGKLIYTGARVAYNAIASTSGCSSEDCTSSGWLAVTNSSFSGADELTISAASAVQAHVQATVAAVSGDVVALTVEMKAGTASNIWLTANNGLAWDTFSTQREINLTSDWVRYSLIGTMSGAGLIVRLIFGDKNKSGTVQTLDGTGTIKIRKAQIENLTAKSVQDAPGEYESVGVAGSVGYGIYNRANGNTVDVNGVVTDTPGAVLATTPVLRHAPAATNQISESSPSTTYWTKRGATTIATVSEGHALGKTTQVRSLGAAGVNDFYLSMGGGTFSNSIRIEPSCLIKAVSTSGSVRIQNAQGPTYGQWTIDLSLLSTSAFGYLTRNHAAVTVNTEFTSTATGAAGLQYYAVSGSLNFDLLGVQLETGSVSTPSIKTTTAPASRTIDQILHPWSESVLSQAQGSIILKVKLKQGTFTPTADRGLVTIHTSVNNILYLNSGDAISAESADGTNTVNSGVVAQSVDDELGIYVSWANSTEYPASGNISVGLKNLTTGSAWAESTGNYDGGYPETASILRLLSGLTCEATIEDLVVYDKLQHPVKLKELFWQGMTDWGYRKSIVLTGSSDGVLTDYQKKIIVHRTAGTDTGSDVYLNGICNSDMSDIRFLDTEGNLLSYWQETRSLQTAAAADTDNRAVFWVKIPRIARSPAKTGIFIYYGNASAPSLSSGSDTFILFDDFDSASGNSAGVDLDNFDCLELDATIGSAELLTQSGMKEIGNVIYEPTDTGKEYKMAYSAGSSLLTAYSSDGKNWTKYSETGLISGVEDPWIFAEGGTYYCYGEIKSGGNTDDLGLWTATDMGGPWSFDSVMITKAVVAGWRDSIVGSPVVWKESSTYYMNYEGVGTGSPKNGQGLATASSPDGPWTEQNTDTVPMTGFEKASGRYAWNGDVISDDHRKIDSTYYCPMHSGVQVKSQPEFPYGTLLGLYKSTDAVSGSMVWSEDPRSPIVWPDLNNSEHFQVFPIDSELYALTYADEWEPEPLGIKLAKFVQANESGIDTDIWDYGHKGQTGRIGVAGGNAVIDVYDSPAGGNGCCTYFQTKTAALPAADFAVLFRVHNPNATMAVSVGTNNTVQGSSGGASLWYDTRLGDGYSAKWYTSYRNRVYKTANAGAQTQVGAEWVGKDHNYNTWMPGTELVYLADGTIEWTVEGVTQYTDLDATYVSGAKYLQFAMGNYSDGRSDGFRILVDYVAVANRTANEPTITYGLEESE